MNESYIWKKLKAGIPTAHFTRHEDKTTRNIPDVSYGLNGNCGWIELKAYSGKSLSAVPSFNNYKRGQRNWLRNRGRVGDNCWLLTGFDDNILLLSWDFVSHCGTATLEELISVSSLWGNIKKINLLRDIL